MLDMMSAMMSVLMLPLLIFCSLPSGMGGKVLSLKGFADLLLYLSVLFALAVNKGCFALFVLWVEGALLLGVGVTGSDLLDLMSGSSFTVSSRVGVLELAGDGFSCRSGISKKCSLTAVGVTSGCVTWLVSQEFDFWLLPSPLGNAGPMLGVLICGPIWMTVPITISFLQLLLWCFRKLSLRANTFRQSGQG